MSHIALQGDVSGTGKITIQSPNTNFDRTLTLPDANGSILTSGSPITDIPAVVRAEYALSAKLVPVNGGYGTLMQFNSKIEDTHNAVTTGASWKFTAPIAGLYLVDSSAIADSPSSTPGWVLVWLYKNNTPYRTLARTTMTSDNTAGCEYSGCVVLRLNAGDYIHLVYLAIGNTSGTMIADKSIISITRIGS